MSNKDCPNRISNSALGDWKSTSNSETSYKILKPEIITPQDIENSHLVECEHNALDGLSAKYFPAIYDYKSYTSSKPSELPMEKDGRYPPSDNYGTVESVGENAIIVQDIHVRNSPYASDHTTVTLRIQPETHVINQGQVSELADLKPGDQVYFTFQDKVVSTGTHNIMELEAPGKDGSIVLLIAKTQYDYRLMDKVSQSLVQNGPVQVIKTTDPNAGG